MKYLFTILKIIFSVFSPNFFNVNCGKNVVISHILHEKLHLNICNTILNKAFNLPMNLNICRYLLYCLYTLLCIHLYGECIRQTHKDRVNRLNFKTLIIFTCD